MQVEFVYQRYIENQDILNKRTTKSEWDWFIMVESGTLSVLPHAKAKPFLLQKDEIAFIPAGTTIDREILSSATFYDLFFYAQKDHPFYLAAPFGKLQLPKSHAEVILESVKRASFLPYDRAYDREPITHLIEHTFSENYLFGSKDKKQLHAFSEKLEDAVRYMRNNLDKKFEMKEVADHIFLSHSGLIWKFKQELGTTPSQYLTFLRMQRAKQLLLNYSYSISEISELCGYQNPYYFTNAFRKYTGKSPTAFRKYHFSYRKNATRTS